MGLPSDKVDVRLGDYALGPKSPPAIGFEHDGTCPGVRVLLAANAVRDKDHCPSDERTETHLSRMARFRMSRRSKTVSALALRGRDRQYRDLSRAKRRRAVLPAEGD